LEEQAYYYYAVEPFELKIYTTDVAYGYYLTHTSYNRAQIVSISFDDPVLSEFQAIPSNDSDAGKSSHSHGSVPSTPSIPANSIIVLGTCPIMKVSEYVLMILNVPVCVANPFRELNRLF
jgi:hypothetical protein